jgi:hypothetical protein
MIRSLSSSVVSQCSDLSFQGCRKSRDEVAFRELQMNRCRFDVVCRHIKITPAQGQGQLAKIFPGGICVNSIYTCSNILCAPSRLTHGSDKNAANAVVCSLCLRASIEQQGPVVCEPAVRILNTPDSDSDTLAFVQARLHGYLVVRHGSTLDVELSDGALAHISANELQSARDVGNWPVAGQM